MNEIIHDSCITDKCNVPIEQAAHKFARELLMPEKNVIAYINRGETTLSDFANHFQVPIQQARIRVLELGYKLK